MRGQRDCDDEYYNDDLGDGDDSFHIVLWAGGRSLQHNRAATLIAQVGR